MPLSRTLAKTITDASLHFPVILLTGPRQVGKTTLMQSLAKSNRRYVSLDDPTTRLFALNDPKLFLETYPPPIIIDEVQYAPHLLTYIKIYVDQVQKNGLFWLTGSQKFALMKGITESLAGRVAIFDLLGLSAGEIEARPIKPDVFLPTHQWIATREKQTPAPLTLKKIYNRIWLGSFPRVFNEGRKARTTFYQSYLKTYIERDVRDFLLVRRDLDFSRFVAATAARTGQILNYNDLARDVGIDNKTAKEWLSILVTSGLVYLLPAYASNLTKRLVKAPKLYFLDTGLCAYLNRMETPETLEASALSGAIFETYVITEILKSYWHNGREAFFYYYRDHNQREVDLLILSGDMAYPVESKKTATPSYGQDRYLGPLKGLGMAIGPGAVISLVKEPSPLGPSLTALPVSYL